MNEIAHANYLQHGPERAMKMLKKDLSKLLLRIDNDGRRDVDADYTDIDAEGLENLEIMKTAIIELLKFGFRKEDLSKFEDFSEHFRRLIVSIRNKNKTLSDEWVGALLGLERVFLHKPKLAEIDKKLPYPE